MTGEAGDDRRVGVGGEGGLGVASEFVGVAAGGVEQAQQRQRLLAHRRLDRLGLAQLVAAQSGVQCLGLLGE